MKAQQAAAAVLEAVALDSTLSAPYEQDSVGIRWFRVRLIVGRVWKGTIPDTIEVLTTEPYGGCGFFFATGHRYLLFLYVNPRDRTETLRATMCSLSQAWASADSAITKLGRPLRRGAA